MILIVGASSSLGRAVIPRLREKNLPLRLSSRNPTALQAIAGTGDEIVQADLLDRDSLVRACTGIERIFTSTHSIMGRGATSSDHIDLEGASALIDVAKELGVQHFVHTSILGANAQASTRFFRNKARIEQHLLESGLPYTILRPAAFFAPHKDSFTNPQAALHGLLSGDPASYFGHGENVRNFVAVEDVARYAVLAFTDPRAMNQIIEMGGPENLTAKQVIALYERALGHSMKVQPKPLMLAKILHAVTGVFHPGLSDVMQMVIEADTIPTPFDTTPTAEQYGIPPTHLTEWIKQQVSAVH